MSFFSAIVKRIVVATIIVFFGSLSFEIYHLFFGEDDSREEIGEHVLEKRQATNFGDWQIVRLCVRLDDRLDPGAVSPFEEALNSEMAPYKLRFELKVTLWTRSYYEKREFRKNEILPVQLPAECDRLLFLTKYEYSPARYVLSGAFPFLFVPRLRDTRVLGATPVVPTRGFVYVHFPDILLKNWTPAHIVEHEVYHMLGCPHADTKELCYERILRAKSARHKDFFPVWDLYQEELITSRDEARDRLREYYQLR